MEYEFTIEQWIANDWEVVGSITCAQLTEAVLLQWLIDMEQIEQGTPYSAVFRIDGHREVMMTYTPPKPN